MIHLHTHSHYSFADALPSPEQLVVCAKDIGSNALAITEHGTLNSARLFWLACQKHNIKPILGLETYFCNVHTERNADEKNRHLILLAKNECGWHNLKFLNGVANREGFYSDPRVDLDLLNKYCDNLICASACASGPISYAITNKDIKSVIYYTQKLNKIFYGEFYIEIQLLDMPSQHLINQVLLQIAIKLNIPTIITSDVHYLRQEDVQIHNMLITINRNALYDPKILHYGTADNWMASCEEITQYTKDKFPYITSQQIESSIANTHKIADQCEVYQPFKLENTYPKYNTKSNIPTHTYLMNEAIFGLKSKQLDHKPEYNERLQKELKAITETNFSDYFLIIWDIVKWAKEHGIVVGPSRGSCGGSLVFYCLDVVALDPIVYGLSFERFLKPGERVSPPDADLDFEASRRHEVIQYIEEKYGRNNVCKIATSNTLALRSAITRVGSALGIDFEDLKIITKSIPYACQSFDDLDKLEDKDKSKLLTQFFKSNPECESFARKLENTPTHSGLHPAGILITPSNTENWIPISSAADSITKTRIPITAWDMYQIDEISLLKVDVLGLDVLSGIKLTLQNIGDPILTDQILNYRNIDTKDLKVYELFHKGYTAGCHQFNTEIATNLCRQIKPKSIEELSIVTSIGRTAIMNLGLHNTYVKRLHGEESIESYHPMVDNILKPTLGIAVYQDQIVEILIKLAGLPYRTASDILKAIKRKEKESIEKYHQAFTDGTKQHATTEQIEKIWEFIVTFAEYGFNINHAMAYAFLGYVTNWLKLYYPLEFYAAFLSIRCDLNDRTQYIQLIREAQLRDYTITYPDINLSRGNFRIMNSNTQPIVVFGLRPIKYVGEELIEVIETKRPQNGFASIDEFITICNPRANTFAYLLMSGALDKLNFLNISNQTRRQKLETFKKVKKSKAKVDVHNHNIRDEEEALGIILDISKLLQKYQKFYEEYEVKDPFDYELEKFTIVTTVLIIISKIARPEYVSFEFITRKGKTIRIDINRRHEDLILLQPSQGVVGKIMFLEGNKFTINSSKCFLKTIEGYLAISSKPLPSSGG